MTNVTRLIRSDAASDVGSDQHWVQRALRAPLSRIATNPWIDAPGLWSIGAIYMPLSRLWAAASVAGGDPDRFLAEIPIDRANAVARTGLSATLRRHEHKRIRAASVTEEWADRFFAAKTVPASDLQALEARRIAQAQKYMLERLRFAHHLLGLGRAVPGVRFDVPSPDDVRRLCGEYLNDPPLAFRPPDRDLLVERSASIASVYGTDYWLRFDSPSRRIGGQAWARVHEPKDGGAMPTFIFANGVCMDVDEWRMAPPELVRLCRSGVRVVELVPPWHGRRSMPGFYGGEPFFGTAPQGPIDLFTAMVQEIAVLIGWSRQQGEAPVGIGGVSMGAIASMLVACYSGGWPAHLRPDALALVAFATDIADLAFESAISEIAGVPDAMRARGWTSDALAEIARLTAGTGEPGVDPAAIVAVLGARDTVTPSDQGRALMTKWGVPSENVFERDLGHLSIAADLSRDDAPIVRLAEILRSMR
jgi:hypothetical protein